MADTSVPAMGDRGRPQLKAEPRKQLSMVLPPMLLNAIKQRSRELSLTVTAYIIQLVRQDLNWSGMGDPSTQERLDQIEQRLRSLEHHDRDL